MKFDIIEVAIVLYYNAIGMPTRSPFHAHQRHVFIMHWTENMTSRSPQDVSALASEHQSMSVWSDWSNACTLSIYYDLGGGGVCLGTINIDDPSNADQGEGDVPNLASWAARVGTISGRYSRLGSFTLHSKGFCYRKRRDGVRCLYCFNWAPTAKLCYFFMHLRSASWVTNVGFHDCFFDRESVRETNTERHIWHTVYIHCII